MASFDSIESMSGRTGRKPGASNPRSPASSDTFDRPQTLDRSLRNRGRTLESISSSIRIARTGLVYAGVPMPQSGQNRSSENPSERMPPEKKRFYMCLMIKDLRPSLLDRHVHDFVFLFRTFSRIRAGNFRGFFTSFGSGSGGLTFKVETVAGKARISVPAGHWEEGVIA